MNFCDFGALVLVTDPSKTDVALITTCHVSSLWETRKRPTINNKSRNTTNFTFFMTIKVVDCGWCKIKMMLVIVACESDVTLIDHNLSKIVYVALFTFYFLCFLNYS